MKALLLIAVLVTAGCSQDTTGSISTSNPNYPVWCLFEKDGVKVYRFYDFERPIYFTTRGETMWQQPEGKTSRPMNVP